MEPQKTGTDLRACYAYLHPPQLPQPPEHLLHPAQPPEARDLRMERTARRTIPTRTLNTMTSPMTCTSFVMLHMVYGKIVQLFTGFGLITLAQQQVQKTGQNSHGHYGKDAEGCFTG